MRTKRTLAAVAAGLIACVVLSGRVPARLAEAATNFEYSRMWTGAMLMERAASKYNGGGDTWPGAIFYVPTDPAKNGQGVFRLPLEATLPPGKYKVLFRELRGGKATVTLGDKSQTLEFLRLAWTPVVLETTQPAQELTITFLPTLKPEQGATQTYFLQGVYITTDLQETVDANDLVTIAARDEKPAGEMARSMVPAKLPANVIENASFELGREHNWGWALGHNGFLTDGNLDATTAADGKISFRFNLDQITQRRDKRYGQVLETKLFQLIPDREYSLSAFVKSAKPMSVTIDLVAHPAKANDSNDGPTVLTQTLNVTAEWQRMTVSGKVPAAPGNLYWVRVRPVSEEANTCWLDAVQLRPDEGIGFVPRESVEIGLVSGVPGNIYFKNEAAPLRLLAYNPQKGTGMANVFFTMSDLFGNTVWQHQVKLPLGGQSNAAATIDLPAQRSGIFRLLAKTDQPDAATKELTLSIIPRPTHLNDFYPEGTLGVDSGTGPAAYEILKRSHFSWIISKGWARWNLVEPENGKFVFADRAVDEVLDAKLNVLIQPLTVGWGVQKWLQPLRKPQNSKRKDNSNDWPEENRQQYVKDWGEFIRTVAEHYKGRVRYWEVENEPNYWMKPEEYRDLLRISYQQLKAADPKNTVLGLSTFYAGWGGNVLEDGGAQYADALSGHYYSNEIPAHKRWADMARRFNKVSWNTETGLGPRTFLTTFPMLEAVGDEHYWERYRDEIVIPRSEHKIKNYLISLGYGEFKHYMYYFARFVNNSPTQPDKRAGNTVEPFEYNGAQRPNATLLSIAASFLDGSQHYSYWKGDPRLQGALFRKGKGSVGFLWSAVDSPLNVKIAAGANELTFYDMMGNALRPGSQAQSVSSQINQYPVYLTSPLPPDELTRHLEQMTLTQPTETIARLVSDNQGHPALRVMVRNGTAQTTDVGLHFGGRLAGFMPSTPAATVPAINPGEQKSIEMPLASLPGGSPSLAIQSRIGAETISKQGQVAVLRAQAAQDIRIDGDLSEWLQGDSANIDKNRVRTGSGNVFADNDLRGATRVSYDNRNLYLSWQTEDDVFKPQAPGEGNEDGDRVRFLISTQFWKHPFARRLGEGDFVIEARALQGGKLRANLTPFGGKPQDVEGAIKSRDGGWGIELVVPWTLLGQETAPPVGTFLGFQVEVYDSDSLGGGTDSEFVWAGAATSWDDPTDWGQLKFD